jgi:hypothetical protein
VSGEEPGLQSVETAIGTPWRRRASIGGTATSFRQSRRSSLRSLPRRAT